MNILSTLRKTNSQEFTSLMRKVKIAKQEVREQFAEVVAQHPTWFIWSLRSKIPTLQPGAQRLAFFVARNAPIYPDALSGVAGVRQMGSSRGTYLAVDLACFLDALYAKGILDRSEPTRNQINRDIDAGAFEFIDFLDLCNTYPTNRGFAWFSDLDEQTQTRIRDARYHLKEPSFTKNATLIWRSDCSTYVQLFEKIQKDLGKNLLPNYEGIIPEQILQVSDPSIAGKAWKDFFQTVNERIEQESYPLLGGDLIHYHENTAALPSDLSLLEPLAPDSLIVDPKGYNKTWESWIGLESIAVDQRIKIVDEAPQPRPLVAVFDTAIDFDHPALAGSWWRTGDFMPPDAESIADQLRRNYHGTACAGLIGGKDPNGKFFGIAPGCRMSGFRVRSGLSSDDYKFPEKGETIPANDSELIAFAREEPFASAIILAHLVAGASVISMSLQYNDSLSVDGENKDLKLVRRAIQMVVKSGCTVVVAAGNVKLGDQSKEAPLLRFPAYMDEVISVAAVYDQNRLLSEWCCQDWKIETPESFPTNECALQTCNRGCNLVHRGSRSDTLITIAAPGWNLATTDVHDFAGIQLGVSSGDYAMFSATSGATAIVSGAVALMLSVNSALRPADIKEILRKTATPIWHTDPRLGNPSRLDFGLINVHAAVEASIKWPKA